MDTHAPGELDPAITYLLIPAVAVRDSLARRARLVLTGGDDGHARTRLRADDVASHPFTMSAHVIRPLAAATLVLDTILTGFEPQDDRFPAVTRDYGMFPMIRSAMLHAARAVFLMRPEQRHERIGRLLAVAHEDAAVIFRAQESLGACTCDTHLIDRAADIVTEERDVPPAVSASDTAVVSAAAEASAFGLPLFGLYEAIDCAARGRMEPFHSFVVAPLSLDTASGRREFVVRLQDIHWVALAALADLVATGWRLADLEEDSDAAAA